MNALVEYIKTHPDWRTELSQKPYCLTIKDDGPYTIFNYSQIDSDFYNSVVRVSRGIILKIVPRMIHDRSQMVAVDRWDPEIKIVCWPFNKFGNYNEGYADKIDWPSALVQEKIDGSIIKVWYDGPECWHVSTNGMIDAYKTDLMNLTDEFKSFGDLFDAAWKNSAYGRGDLIDAFGGREKYTFIFELTSPWNRVVIPYKDIKISLLGIRNLETGEEIDPDSLKLNFDRPRMYGEYFFGTSSYPDLSKILERVKELPYDEEGYVVVDKDFHRVKIKSLAYLAAHHLKENGNVNPKRVLDLIKTGEDSEFIAYFPEYVEHFNKVREKYTATLESISSAMAVAKEWKNSLSTKKEFAMKVLAEPPKIRKYMFAVWDDKDVQVMINALSYDDLL